MNSQIPQTSYIKKAPIPIPKLIRDSCRSSHSCLHIRWSHKNYEQGWKKLFYPHIKMIIDVKFEGTKVIRSTVFRKFPIYPPGTWHKRCYCSFCRCRRWQLFVPEDVSTIRLCHRLKPVRRLNEKECGDLCHKASLWNRSNEKGGKHNNRKQKTK